MVLRSPDEASRAVTPVHSPSKTGVNALEDGLWRNPGAAVPYRAAVPDFAALHPGYGRDGGTWVARLPADQATAMRLHDALSEMLDLTEDAVAAFEVERGWVVEILFRQAPDEAAVRALVAAAAGAETARALSFAFVPDKNWVAASIAGLAPVEAGRFVVHGGHDRARVPANRTAIEIEAALAFGTGHHGTTRACLLALDAIVKSRRPSNILDVGCGSGVLAIAAARALRVPVLASDIDRRAVVVARGNARVNRAGGFVEVIHAAGVRAARIRVAAPFDLVFANILLGPLLTIAGPLVALLAPGARVVLSGMLAGHANAALAAYRAHGLLLQRRIDLDGWVTLVLVNQRRAATSRNIGR
jgi:ribosomal protein L11 methyltransferase